MWAETIKQLKGYQFLQAVDKARSLGHMVPPDDQIEKFKEEYNLANEPQKDEKEDHP